MNMSPPFVPAPHVTAASWVIDRLQGFADSVVSIVPAGFQAYARIYHPAWHTIDGNRTRVRWSDVATVTQRVPHRQMQWPSIIGGYLGSGDPLHHPVLGDSFEEPIEGSLPPDVSHPLWQVLASHTITQAHCWFAVWEGWECLNSKVRSSPSFALPNRLFYLFYGSIEAIEVSFCAPQGYHQSANLWWPNDRAWCVATEIDFMTTYVAGTDAAIAALMECKALEVDKVEPTDGVTWASDIINPPPL